MSRHLARELLAEALGTFVLIAFGVGVVAQTVLSASANGSYLAINLGWGIGVTLGVLVAGGVSGAHLNPAVTIALAAHRGLPWRKVLPYAAAQTLGAFAAAAVVYVTYREAFAAFDGGVRQIAGAQGTAGIFATYPQAFLSLGGGLVDQVVGTALLIIGVFAIGDARNVAVPGWLGPLLVGLLVVGIGVSFGFNAGYAINPARDFGPRLFTAMAGWGAGVFGASGGWWWVPIVGPVVGAVLGGAVYDACVTRLHDGGTAR
ncbi:MAG: MIP family channel protein [Vicinamibacterales bacterium]